MAKFFKKLIIPGLAVCLAAFIGIMFAACSNNDSGSNGEGDNGTTDNNTKTYTVTFDLQESTINDENLTIQNKPEAQTVNEDAYATEPTQPVAYWTFGGWYKEAACTNEFVFTTEKITADTTVYAKWTAPECPAFNFASKQEFYMSGYSGDISGTAYSTSNTWESTNNFVDPPVTTTYTYNKISLAAGESVSIMWHLDGVVADTTYKFDIRLGNEYKQDANVRAGLNIWIQDATTTDFKAPFVYSNLARKFGLIGMQISFTADELSNLGAAGGATMLKVIIQNPTDIDFDDIRIICAVGDAH